MKHCMMFYAGYKHLSCDPFTHIHRLLNMATGQVELWVPAPKGRTGLPYKNTHLEFFEYEFEHERKKDNTYGETSLEV